MAMAFIAILPAAAIAATLDDHPNTPLPLWGSYRPSAAMALRARVPHSPVISAMVATPAANLIHAADHVARASFSYHDPRVFHEQHIELLHPVVPVVPSASSHPALDTRINVTATWLDQTVHPASHKWTWRIRLDSTPQQQPPQPISLVVAIAVGPEEWASPVATHPYPAGSKLQFGPRLAPTNSGGWILAQADNTAVGDFQVAIQTPPLRLSIWNRIRRFITPTGPNNPDDPRVSTLAARQEGDAWWATEKIVHQVWKKSGKRLLDQDALTQKQQTGPSNILLVQIDAQLPFSVDIAFRDCTNHDGRCSSPTASNWDLSAASASFASMIEQKKRNFRAKFEHKFRLEHTLGPGYAAFAREVLSNLLGGIGYYHGSSVLKLDQATNHLTKNEIDSGLAIETQNLFLLPPVSLLTATPSRVVFPRGFFWDEGFHQLLLLAWDQQLAMECLGSWMAVQTSETGWFPREQILGHEPRGKFPSHIMHLLYQDPSVANPPTILMPLRVLAAQLDRVSAVSDVEQQCLADEFGQCRDDSSGSERANDQGDALGYNTTITMEFWDAAVDAMERLVAWLEKTQSSQSHPNLFNWKGRSMDQVTPDGYPHTLASGLDDYPRGMEPHPAEFHLDLQCWMIWSSRALAQVSQMGSLDRDTKDRKFSMYKEKAAGFKKALMERGRLCDNDGKQDLCDEGYVTLFPLLLGVLDPSNPSEREQLLGLVGSLEDPDRLLAPCGVRSLSRASSFFSKGDNYWTGPCWQPFNYLTLAALDQYRRRTSESEEFTQRVDAAYRQLREVVIESALSEWRQSGLLFEQYSDDDGRGLKGKMFTGWSSLVVLVMSETYDGVVGAV